MGGVERRWREHDSDPFTAAALGELDVLKQIIGPENVNDRNMYGWTALMHASYYGKSDVASYLIESGADKKIQCKKGRTALMIATICGYLDILELVVETEILNWTDYFGLTALSLAIEFRHKEILTFLLCKGADPNIVLESGTALMVAAERGHYCPVLLLLRHNADINKINYNGKTAKMLAQENGHTEIVTLINILEGLEIEPILKELGLKEYLKNFKEQNISFEQFIYMTEDEMKEIGITIFGRRRKLAIYLEQIRKHYNNLFSTTENGPV